MDSNRTKQRSWPAIVATFIVAAALLFANLDGYHNHIFGEEGEFFAEPPLINWAHGWPCQFMVRHSVYPLSGIYSADGFTGPHGTNSRWPFDGARVSHFWITLLIIDGIFFLLMLAGTAYAMQRLSARLRENRTFSLKSLLGAMMVIAVLLAELPSMLGNVFQHAFAESVPLSTKLRYSLQFSAIAIIALAACLTLLAAAHIVVRAQQYRRSA